MTTNLPPLAEALRELAKRQNPYHTAPLAEALVDLAEDLAPRYDEQIAALEAEVARLRTGTGRFRVAIEEISDLVFRRCWSEEQRQATITAKHIHAFAPRFLETSKDLTT